MYNVPLAIQCIYGCSDGGENGDKEKGRESGDCLAPCLYADDLALRGESKEDLRIMMGRFLVCRRCLKVNAGKSKVMLLGEGEGLECEVYVNAVRI